MHSPRRSVTSDSGMARGQKGGKARAGNIAIGARADPARDQSQRHAARSRRQRGALGRIFEIQQAEIIFPSLAHHRFFGALDRIGIEMGDLLHDLALQIAGVGGDPKTRAVLLGPQAGGRQIAQGLAGAGAGFDQGDAGRAGILARPEGIGRGLAIGRLFRARLPTSRISRALASSGVTGCEPGVPTGASSSHCGRPRQASSPAMGEPCCTSFPDGGLQQRRPAPARPGQRLQQRRQLLARPPAASPRLPPAACGPPAQEPRRFFRASAASPARSAAPVPGRWAPRAGRAARKRTVPAHRTAVWRPRLSAARRQKRHGRPAPGRTGKSPGLPRG